MQIRSKRKIKMLGIASFFYKNNTNNEGKKMEMGGVGWGGVGR